MQNIEHSLTVFIDFKSPYAYLAVEPTRQLARQSGVAIDWMPFVKYSVMSALIINKA